MNEALREQRAFALQIAVALAAIIAAGCSSAVNRVDRPVELVSARDALAGYRIPEYVERVPERPAERRPPVQPPVKSPVPKAPEPPRPTPANRAGWAVANPRDWRYIIIHHSHTDRGNAAIFDRYHRQARHWENGLGYHFVIGNGTDSGDGEVEVGSRWKSQIQGAHAGVWLYNQFGIGICLVGDFEEHKPTRLQIAALVELVDYLCATYRIPRTNILRHGDIKSTKCPGKYFPFEQLFRK